MGRPAIEITEEILKKAELLSSHGHDQDQIAILLGMGKATFYEKKKKFPEFQDAITRGKVKGGAVVASKLMEAVQNGSVSAMIWYEKTRLGKSEKVNVESSGTVTHKHTAVSESIGLLRKWRERGGEVQSDSDSLPN